MFNNMGLENRYESLLHLAENQAVDVLIRPGLCWVKLVLMLFRNFIDKYRFIVGLSFCDLTLSFL